MSYGLELYNDAGNKIVTGVEKTFYVKSTGLGTWSFPDIYTNYPGIYVETGVPTTQVPPQLFYDVDGTLGHSLKEYNGKWRYLIRGDAVNRSTAPGNPVRWYFVDVIPNSTPSGYGLYMKNDSGEVSLSSDVSIIRTAAVIDFAWGMAAKAGHGIPSSQLAHSVTSMGWDEWSSGLFDVFPVVSDNGSTASLSNVLLTNFISGSSDIRFMDECSICYIYKPYL